MITRTIYVACDECMDQAELDLDSIGGWWNLLLDMGWKFTYHYEDGWEYTRDPRHIDTTTCPVCVETRDDEDEEPGETFDEDDYRCSSAYENIIEKLLTDWV